MPVLMTAKVLYDQKYLRINVKCLSSKSSLSRSLGSNMNSGLKISNSECDAKVSEAYRRSDELGNSVMENQIPFCRIPVFRNEQVQKRIRAVNVLLFVFELV